MRTGRFVVEIDGVQVDGFRTIDLPSRGTELVEYQEGDDTDRTLWGQTSFDDLEMERGLAAAETQLIDWRRTVERGQTDEARKEIAVKIQDEEGQAQIRWEFTNAWPKNYYPPTLDATADGEVATESVTIVFDEMIREEL